MTKTRAGKQEMHGHAISTFKNCEAGRHAISVLGRDLLSKRGLNPRCFNHSLINYERLKMTFPPDPAIFAAIVSALTVLTGLIRELTALLHELRNQRKPPPDSEPRQARRSV